MKCNVILFWHVLTRSEMGRDARLTGEIIRKDIQRVIFASKITAGSEIRPEQRFTTGIKTKEIPYDM